MAIEISDRPRRAQWRPKPRSKASSLRNVASLSRSVDTSQLVKRLDARRGPLVLPDVWELNEALACTLVEEEAR